jgi:hypothetical protein
MNLAYDKSKARILRLLSCHKTLQGPPAWPIISRTPCGYPLRLA